MYLDLSFEYDASFEEFKYNKVLDIINGDIWISYHTDLGREFLEYYNWYGNIHKRFKINNKLAKAIKEAAHTTNLSVSLGGFYWNDINHTQHNGK